jgi:hypothetical protein
MKAPITVIVTLPYLSGIGDTRVHVLIGLEALAPHCGHVNGLPPLLGKPSHPRAYSITSNL